MWKDYYFSSLSQASHTEVWDERMSKELFNLREMSTSDVIGKKSKIPNSSEKHSRNSSE